MSQIMTKNETYVRSEMAKFVDVIPESCFEGIVRYVTRGEPVGSFLTALLCNNFIETLYMADDYNKLVLFEYAKLLHWALPGSCWGSPENVKAWIAKGGLEGKTKATS